MSNENKKLNKDRIDGMLSSAESQKVGRAVGMLQDDDLSLAWRSQLNEKILAEANSKRKRLTLKRIWGYSAGLGLSTVAGVALFFALVPNTLEQARPSITDSIEGQMLSAHHTVVRSADAAGDGLSTLDETEASAAKEVNEWKPEDLEAL